MAEQQRIFAIVRSFARTDVSAVLDSLGRQSRSPDVVVVAESNTTPLIERDAIAVGRPFEIRHLCARGNVGPAGATSAALDLIQPDVRPDDLIPILDDDIPLARVDYFERVLAADVALRSVDPRLAGLGRIGHRFDWNRARLLRPKAAEIRGVFPVDYFPTGYAPCFRAHAVYEIGGFRSELFVGLTEVEFGLRLRRAGYNLYVLGDLWGASPNHRPDLFGVHFPVKRATWRRYYTTRNLIALLMENGMTRSAALASLRALAGSGLRAARDPTLAPADLQMTVKGLIDGWRGRLGKTIEPPHR